MADRHPAGIPLGQRDLTGSIDSSDYTRTNATRSKFGKRGDSGCKAAVAAPRTSLHACVGLSTSHSPSLASSSREWVPGMGARQMQQWRRARNTDANTRAAPGAAVSCHVGLLR